MANKWQTRLERQARDSRWGGTRSLPPARSGGGGVRTRLRGQMTPSFERKAGLPRARPAPANGERAPPPASGDPAPHPLRRNPPPVSRLRSPSLRRGNVYAAASGPRTPRSGWPGRTEAAACPARLPPPLSGECLPGWGAADGHLGATRAGYAHALITRADPPPRALALRTGTRSQPRTVTWADPGVPDLPLPRQFPGASSPMAGVRARACVHCSLASRPAGLQADKINTPSLASSSYGWALRHDQFYESNPFQRMATP